MWFDVISKISIRSVHRSSFPGKFLKVQKRTKYIITDAMFNGLSPNEQMEIAMKHIPTLKKKNCTFETRPEVYGAEPKIWPVQLRKAVWMGEIVKESPQSLLNMAACHLEESRGMLATDEAWKSTSLQLKDFMKIYNFDTKSHYVDGCLKDSEKCSNLIYKIYKEDKFDPDHFLGWFPKKGQITTELWVFCDGNWKTLMEWYGLKKP
ncbi:hypothetical protein Mgra_00000046 [Meloidogyne graminicola]|uniref:Uncharacterized protein n=1 Tax=Meloidogyne graminicola TaxID=189291 RepID=A0A8T0A4A1_9BILA|nr:hypothetical protein Mgra_00000046 [Meloidogyne graminicola]